MDHDQEQMRLAELYAAMNDGELEALAEDWESLTDAARQALQHEAARRGMDLEEYKVSSQEEDDGKLKDPVTVAEFPEIGEALLAQGLLASGGIASALSDAGDKPLDPDWLNPRSGRGLGHVPGVNAGIKLQVNATDVESAREVLDQPIQADPESE
jgi:hypothetical protein